MLHRFTQGATGLDSMAISQRYQDNRSEEMLDNPLYQANDQEAHDLSFAYKIAREMIRVNGAHVLIHPRTRNEDIDGVFDEDADPTYWSPQFFKGFFVPQPLEFELTEWGLDTKNQVEIVFFRDDLIELLGDRLSQIGDIIEIPYNSASQQKPKYYRVDNAQETGNFRYQWLYMTCQCTLLSGDVNIRPAVSNDVPIDDYPDPDMLDNAV
jgi:hypothetical protein